MLKPTEDRMFLITVLRHLVSILSPLLHNKYLVNNSAEFVMKINNQIKALFIPGKILVSFVVISLFTLISVKTQV